MCTEFILPVVANNSNNGDSVVSGRTLDWELNMPATLHRFPPGHAFKLPVGLGSESYKSSSNAIVGIGVTNPKSLWPNFEAHAELMNDDGLSVACLFLPGAKYEPRNLLHPQNNIHILLLAPWIVTQFTTKLGAPPRCQANCQDVHYQLKDMNVVGANDDLPKVHCVVHDAQGHSLVIEFPGDGTKKMYLYDETGNPIDDSGNPIPTSAGANTAYAGVLTNYPPLPLQLDNLAKFEGLTYINKQQTDDNAPQEVNGSGMAGTEPGGDFGLPGDPTPESRFVRAAMLRTFVAPRINETDQSESIDMEQHRVQQALHVLNNVDVVYGSIRASYWKERGGDAGDFTQWSVVRDHVNMQYYFRSALNMNLRRVDLTKPVDNEEKLSIFGGSDWCPLAVWDK